MMANCKCGCGRPLPPTRCYHKGIGWRKDGPPRSFISGHGTRLRDSLTFYAHKTEAEKKAVVDAGKQRYALKHHGTERFKNLCQAARDRRKNKMGTSALSRSNKNAQMKYRYGITFDQFEKMILEQGGTCAICRRPFGLLGLEKPAMDHSHNTGENRAVIHKSCNLGLGYFKDDPTLLRLAAEYMDKYQKDVD